MPLAIAMKDLKPEQVRRPGKRPGSTHTHLLKATRDNPDVPTFMLVEHTPDCLHAAHYHDHDEFQVVTEGGGKFGRHELSAYSVHFARAYTPYGPLLSDKEKGWAFVTLRTHWDQGAQKFPTSLEKLKQVPNRRPWQATQHFTFPHQEADVNLQQLDKLKDEQGLSAYALSMAPNTRTVASDASNTDGQYVLVVKGSVVYENREREALGAVFVKPGEAPLQIQAGPQGLQAFILNFPRVKQRPAEIAKPSAAAGCKKWQCTLCSFKYDEALGMPEEGIPAGTRWEDVPETWNCPDCSTAKSDFQMVVV